MVGAEVDDSRRPTSLDDSVGTSGGLMLLPKKILLSSSLHESQAAQLPQGAPFRKKTDEQRNSVSKD